MRTMSWRFRSWLLRGARRAGFTLIEIMVTLVVISLVIGLAVVNLQPSEKRTMEREAGRLALLLELAAEEAYVTGTDIGFSIDGADYGFYQPGEVKKWTPYKGDDLFREGSLHGGVRLMDMEVNNRDAPPGSTLVFSSSGHNDIFDIYLALGAGKAVLHGDPLGRVVLTMENG